MRENYCTICRTAMGYCTIKVARCFILAGGIIINSKASARCTLSARPISLVLWTTKTYSSCRNMNYASKESSTKTADKASAAYTTQTDRNFQGVSKTTWRKATGRIIVGMGAISMGPGQTTNSVVSDIHYYNIGVQASTMRDRIEKIKEMKRALRIKREDGVVEEVNRDEEPTNEEDKNEDMEVENHGEEEEWEDDVEDEYEEEEAE